MPALGKKSARKQHYDKITQMTKLFSPWIILLMPSFISGQESKVFDSISFESKILKKEKTFALYLPKGYETSQRKYPVLYLLHGGGEQPPTSRQKKWIQQGDVQRIADSAIDKAFASPMIIVMPDAEMTYYMNNVHGKYQFEDFFFQELIPYIEKNYRCLTGKQYRAIAGQSMGGFGSLLYSIHHPEIFGTCAAMSAAVFTDEEIINMPYNEYLRRFRTAMGEVKEGDPRITDFWNQNSILYLVKQVKEEQKKAVRYYLDIGDDDFLYKGNSLLHISMRDLNIPHEYLVRNGTHNWEYWKNGLPGVLNFVSEGFK
jgi:enterochelin esterase-like enzyme